MKQEWIERMHDQARAEKGVCTQASTGNWCDQHGALKFPGEEACRAMVEAYVIAESAGEVMEGLARTDAEDFFTTVTIPNIKAEIRNRLRAKVKGLRDVEWAAADIAPDYESLNDNVSRSAALTDVLALLKETP